MAVDATHTHSRWVHLAVGLPTSAPGLAARRSNVQAILTRTPPADPLAAPTIASVVMQPTACSLGNHPSDAAVGPGVGPSGGSGSGAAQAAPGMDDVAQPGRAGGWLHVRFCGEVSWTRVSVDEDERALC